MDTTTRRRVDALLRNACARVAREDAELLLTFVLGKPRSWLFAHDDAELDASQAARFETLLARRVQGEPVAYLVGSRGFWTFDLAVTPDTLIPRPETERLVEAALSRLPADTPLRIADLGTGSGAIALALASECPQSMVVATDASEAALAVARGNADAARVANIRFRVGDWYGPLREDRFDLIASNPPYIAGDDEHLQRGDLRFEPVQALTPGGDGLSAIRVLAAGAPRHLLPGGWLLLEHGHDQGDAVRTLLVSAGLVDVATLQDLEHRDRVTLGRWRP
ncbi:peptide chain release factor N(5)-glutamine methyltransferase [Luteimonas aestuarii]|uniref:Release factor glutamine methyltransferase n=1 Tax=Luteimonas aestuarii TaxID=453837 RepID=A0A4R5TK38_9GAMM|nr:peptide chain release factor N(5)-glutamine methyltransferase [Luteimonas aestuarii]TDK21737.1 peptide chain release factor N(5)-glutamine methyltransferase [Luteimonas aestuarii]